MIFTYYEQHSSELHYFLPPGSNSIWFSGGTIDIPTYVSNGYLVFVADIHYKPGNPGQGAYNSVVAAAQYLAKKPWVDARHMGLDGHSFGGYQTNYIVAHSHLFAAACAASGWSNFTSSSNRVRTDGRSGMQYYEMGKERIGASLWERPDLYIQSSPLFRANKVTTPLLMMNNKHDSDVDFYEGVQFFTALRRLGKKYGCCNMTREIIV